MMLYYTLQCLPTLNSKIVSTSKKSGMPDNLIVKVIRKGYVIDNKVLRHSLVEIIKNK